MTTIQSIFKNRKTSAPAPKAVPTRKHITAAQVAQFMREREAKGLEPVERIDWVVRQINRGIKFDGCGAQGCQLGVYVGVKYVRVCHRCKGRGEQTASDRARFNTWQMAGDRGVRKSSYHEFNETNAYATV